MKIYLAGGIGYKKNIMPIKSIEGGRDKLNIYLAGCNGREYIIEEYLKTCVFSWRALTHGGGNSLKKKELHPMILESFYYVNPETVKLIPYYEDFLLDSGAFSFMTNGKTTKNINWQEYIDKYIRFINEYDIKKFFELDIDNIVGYDEVLKIREYINKKTGKQCIPVWHKSRGIAEFKKMCSEYPYVAIGGIVSKEFSNREKEKFPLLIREAHVRGAKIHGLGFTNLKLLSRYHFDSVDSTAWVSGNRFGGVYKFIGNGLIKLKKGENQRLKDSRLVAIHNFTEWVKFQRWALTHL